MKNAELELAVLAAREAGLIAMRHFGSDHARWEKGPGQIVTEADIEIDRHLHGRLLADGRSAWLSEETEDDPSRLDAERVWIVDPIDGTRSFAAGKPEFTISIALADAAGPLVGVVLNPAKDQLYEAARGQGARLNGEPITVAVRAAIEGANVVVSESENRRRRFTEILPQAELRVVGSLAYKLARVAAGDFDAFFSWRNAHDWDIAAAMLILSEAGGQLSDAAGASIQLNQPVPRHRGLIGASPSLHALLRRVSIDGLARVAAS